MALRRALARRQRARYRDLWPIDEVAARPPVGWKGWPGGQRLAFSISHDVEGPAGLENCRALAELEMQLGFRSCFNFVPEGSYTVPPSLRTWLTGHGFEVGVHDLHHDGKLYRSASAFRKNARRINSYLKDWGAHGFRAGFMLRNLDWHHELDIDYDSSTFDTDPFEMQAEGVRTIFPFWVDAPASVPTTQRGGQSPRGNVEPGSQTRGYVEIPYTLPQDSTLFLVLSEKSPEIWCRKMAWIARQGGLAFVNVHPDYLSLDNAPHSDRTYPVAYYKDFLLHVRELYGREIFYTLPWEIATSYKESRVASRCSGEPALVRADSLRTKRAAVLLYSDYPADPRPRRAAKFMVGAGMNVELLCLAENGSTPRKEFIDGVEVTRVRLARRRDSKLSYFWKYGRFLTASFWFLTWRGFWRKYDVVHVHNMPDILVFAALPAKLRGAKIILDLHDPMPELMMTIFGSRPNGIGISVLKLLERWSLGFADVVLTVNDACREIFSGRSCPRGKIHVLMNTPDEAIFALREPTPEPKGGNGTPFVFMYHGSLVERHGLDLAVAALALTRRTFPNTRLRIYGHSTPFLEKVMREIARTGVDDAVAYLGPKRLEEIVEAINACDAGIIPNRRSIFTEINTPTRIFEYLSQGKPVIAPRARGIQDYFGPDDLFYFQLGDVNDLAAQMERVQRDADARCAASRRGQTVYLKHIWTTEQEYFRDVLCDVLGRRARATPALTVPCEADLVRGK